MLGRFLRAALGPPSKVRANEKGIRLWGVGALRDAEACFRTAISADSRYAPACSNLGMVLLEQGRKTEALEYLRRAVDTDPRLVGARVNLAAALYQLQGAEAAMDHYREARRLDPENVLVKANSLRVLMELCAWDEVASRVREIEFLARGSDESWADEILPFDAMLFPFDGTTQLRIARRYAGRVLERVSDLPRARRQRKPGARLRIGYVSNDFRDNAVAYLCAGLFEAHDRQRFEVFAYSLGVDDGGAYRRRIAGACEHFVDVAQAPSAAIAERIAGDGIEVLIDMKGYTGFARPEVFALRPAPVQVDFLGNPGTSGASFIDYLVADEKVIPQGGEPHYSECIVRLPNSYQPNDGGELPGEAPSRAAAGLAESVFVFCCFNQHFKIERVIFSAWMNILAAVPGSVLWLIAGTAASEARLRSEASRAGIDPARLLFAPLLPRGEHLARLRLAQLCLDTHHCNGGATGSDALRAGVPLLTWAGRTFASRVGASLVSAAGLGDMVVADVDAYRREAIALALAPARLADLRGKLETVGRGSPLFDCAQFTRHLELAFERMVALSRNGTPAQAMDIPK